MTGPLHNRRAVGPSMAFFGVRRVLEMIVSHRAPSSFDMSPYRAIWTHFRPDSINFLKKKSWTWSWIRSWAWSLDLDLLLDLVLDEVLVQDRVRDLVMDLAQD